MSFYGHKNFEVKVKDLLTGEEMGISMSDSKEIPTQEAAEVRIATNPTPFGGDHPGFEIKPKDQAKFDAAMQEWVDANPEKAKAILERKEYFLQHPDEIAKLKADIAEAEKKMKEKADKEAARLAAV